MFKRQSWKTPQTTVALQPKVTAELQKQLEEPTALMYNVEYNATYDDPDSECSTDT